MNVVSSRNKVAFSVSISPKHFAPKTQTLHYKSPVLYSNSIPTSYMFVININDYNLNLTQIFIAFNAHSIVKT